MTLLANQKPMAGILAQKPRDFMKNQDDKMKPKQKQYYVLTGNNPGEWCESKPMGPFESENKAREAIRESTEEICDSWAEHRIGTCENFAEVMTIVEVVRTFQPVIDVSVEVSLRNVELHKEESK